MDEKQLRCFLTIAETGSVSAAAQRLDIAQPSLSQILLRLEEELDNKLFQRTSRGVTLTDSGRVFREHAFKIVSDFQRARDEIVFDANAHGEVTVGLPSSFSTLIGARLISELREKAPYIKLKLMEAMSGHIREWLTRGELDIGVLYSAQDASHLSIQQIAVEELFLVGHQSAFVETGLDGLAAQVVDLQRVGRYPLILPTAHHGLRRLVDQRVKRSECELDIHMEVDSLTLIKSLLRSEHGFSLLPHAAISEELRLRQLTAARVLKPDFRRGVFVARNSSQLVTRASVQVVEIITELAWRLIRDGEWIATSVRVPRAQI